MAQPSTIQREPSMEEILASIRRIIEDSDAAKTAEEERSQPAAAAVPPPANDSAVEVEAFRADLQTSRPEPPAETRKSMADIQAAADLTALDIEMEEPVAAASSAARQPPTFGAVDRGPGSMGWQASRDGAETGAAATRAALPDADETEPRQSIISERAGRQVAAAFGELSEAFAASRRRSFDEMAEEMIRPMLREWMDNNLPVLVERLVREEIERVARGA